MVTGSFVDLLVGIGVVLFVISALLGFWAAKSRPGLLSSLVMLVPLFGFGLYGLQTAVICTLALIPHFSDFSFSGAGVTLLIFIGSSVPVLASVRAWRLWRRPVEDQ